MGMFAFRVVCTYITVSSLISFSTSLTFVMLLVVPSYPGVQQQVVVSLHNTKHCAGIIAVHSGVCIHMCTHAFVQHTHTYYTQRVYTVHQSIQFMYMHAHTYTATYLDLKELEVLVRRGGREYPDQLSTPPHLFSPCTVMLRLRKGVRGAVTLNFTLGYLKLYLGVLLYFI